MKLKAIMQNELSQKEKDKYCIVLLISGLKKNTKGQTHKNRVEWWLTGAGDMGEIDEVGKKV